MTGGPDGKNWRALAVIYLIVALDAAGIGLVMPVLPGLLQRLGGEAATGWPYGVFLALYALMQFLFSPLLGQLSDRFGRRLVLLVSLGGAFVNYAVMAMLPPLWLLFIARAIAGMTGANMAVASAYLADITAPEMRAARFGTLSACFGLGFIVGPALGGVMADWGAQYPFVAAAVITGLTFVLSLTGLPKVSATAEAEPHTLNPLASFTWLGQFKGLVAIISVFIVFAMTGEIGGTIWVLYGQAKFHWPGLTVGLSLAAFGLFHAAVQAFLTGPLTRRWGDRAVLLFGMAMDGMAYILIALASQGWQAFALIPLFCLGGLGQPVLSALTANKVSDDAQGRLQGVLASLASLASIVTPVLVTSVFFATRHVFPGAVWVAGAGLYLVCLPVVLGKTLYGAEKALVNR